MDDGTQLLYARRYYRRRYTKTDGTLDLNGLRAAADALVSTITEEVLLTSHQFDGGGASGQAKFPKVLAGLVLEELIAEADTSLPREVTQTQATFRAATT